MNVSKYKKIILEVLNNNPVHPNANELYQLVKVKNPEVGIATIYRNLDSLVACGEVLRFNTDSGYDRYDGTTAGHYHMICKGCSKVYDLPEEILTGLNDKVSNLTGHKVEEHKIVFIGKCNKCI